MLARDACALMRNVAREHPCVAVRLLKATLSRGIALDVRLEDEDMFVLGERMHFYVPRTMSTGAICDGQYLQLSIAGVGVRADALKRIFDPFFITRKVGEVTGQGLSLMDGIVREYRGAIDVETAIGAGSRFVGNTGYVGVELRYG